MSFSLNSLPDVIDSRDIDERLEELEAAQEEYQEYLEQMEEWKEEMGQMEENPYEFDEVPEQPSELPPLSPEETEELEKLKKICEEGRQECPDWEHGETLIHRLYWVQYVEEMLEDCGYICKDLPAWIKIDWSGTADEVESDYSSITIEGQEYLFRSC